ncbi:MAG: hypothetical protein IJE89_04565 [Bacilli bacterium]|nr:hypothetical protein [Bacilli bacterium]
MDKIYIQLIIETLLIFIAVFLFNYFVFVRKNKKLKKDEMPLELIYLSGIYEINPKKINFRSFQYAYCFINSFIITATYLAVTYLIKTMLLKVIIGIVLLVLLIVICYGLLGRYYLYKEIKESNQKKKKK